MQKVNKLFKDVKIAVICADRNACGMYRVELPYRNLINKGYSQFTIFEQQPSFNELKDFDIILHQRVEYSKQVYINDNLDNPHKFQKDYLKIYNKGLQQNFPIDIIRQLKSIGKIIIHEIDDNLFNLPKFNNCYESYKIGTLRRKNVVEALKIADFVHTTTDKLSSELSKHSNTEIKKYHSFNNSIDLSMTEYKINRRNELPQNKIVVGYHGSSSHEKDLQLIIPVIRQIIQENDNVVFAMCSNPQFFSQFKLPIGKGYMIPPIMDKFNNFIPIPSCFDINITPLEDTAFNQCKSYLKIVENASYKIPTIASAVGDYKEYGNQNKNSVMLVRNNTKDWKKAIQKLIDDENLRREIGLNAYNSLIGGNSSLEFVNNKRLDFYKSLCND